MGAGIRLLGRRAPATDAPALSVGARAASAAPACAAAWRARASAVARARVPFRPPVIRALSWSSPRLVHQSVTGQAAGDTLMLARAFSPCSEDGSVSSPSGCRPPLEAQPTRAKSSAADAASRYGRISVCLSRSSVFVAEHAKHALQVITKLCAFFLGKVALGLFQHRLVGRAHMGPDRLAGLGELDAQGTPVLFMRTSAQGTLGLELVEQARHGRAVHFRCPCQLGGRHRATGGQALDDQELGVTQVHAQLGEGPLKAAHQLAPDHGDKLADAVHLGGIRAGWRTHAAYSIAEIIVVKANIFSSASCCGAAFSERWR